MKALADYVHSQGLKFGVYTSRGTYTCQMRPASLNYEAIDGASYCEWGLDYIKIDGCRGSQDMNTSWSRFHESFQQCITNGGRYILESVETCGDPDTCGQWVGTVSDLWRTGGDIQCNWNSVLAQMNANDRMVNIAKPGNFNDPDMLEVGNPGLTLDEQHSHFGMWCIASSPLLISTDIIHASKQTIILLTKTEAIEVNQDLGLNGRIQGRSVVLHKQPNTRVWVKPLADGKRYAVFLVNIGNTAQILTVSFTDLNFPGTSAAVRDLWNEKDIVNITNGVFTSSRAVPSHGSVFITLQ